MPGDAAHRYRDGPTMATVEVRCYGELNDFLPAPRRQRSFRHDCGPGSAVKDTLESLGVPHPEIDLILVNGQPAGFGCPLAAGDRVAVYPRFRRLDVSGISPVHVPLPAECRFLLDGHLGRLARYLRLLGCDAAHDARADDADLAARAAREGRILLTRDLDLLRRAAVQRGYRVRSTDPERQTTEVMQQFDLAGRVAPFTRCLPCGERLVAAPADAATRVPAGVAARHRDYRQCPGCGRLYWAGSHYRRLADLVDRLTAASGPGGAPPTPR
jgi:uncharacterized protein